MLDRHWHPSDPIHTDLLLVPAVDEACLAMTRHGGGRPMHWMADEAVAAPWPWLCGDAAIGAGHTAAVS